MLLGHGAVSVTKLTALRNSFGDAFLSVSKSISKLQIEISCVGNPDLKSVVLTYFWFSVPCFHETLGENKLRDTLCNDKLIKILKKEGETKTAPPFSLIGANQLLTPGEPLIFPTQLQQSSFIHTLASVI